MTSQYPENRQIVIRPVQYRDLEAMESIAAALYQTESSTLWSKELEHVRQWYGLLKLLSLFPNPCQDDFRVYVAQWGQEILGALQVSPFNSTRSTWQVNRVLVNMNATQPELVLGRKGIGSQLLRYCFENIWEARTWLLEVNVNEKKTLSLYRENGFQPLAQITYWRIPPEVLQQLAAEDRDLPNLLPVSNRDAQLLYQLDTVSMPPLLRQVFDRHIQDFKTGISGAIVAQLRQWLGRVKIVSGYVFEPQRKAAIGYFKLEMSKIGSRPHEAEITVHPAYTWLYPKLFAPMALVLQDVPPQSLTVASADYQPEREAYLEKLGGERMEHTLLMTRSLWHKLRESKSLDLHLSEVLQKLQPARTPLPTPMSLLQSTPTDNHNGNNSNSFSGEGFRSKDTPENSSNGHHG